MLSLNLVMRTPDLLVSAAVNTADVMFAFIQSKQWDLTTASFNIHDFGCVIIPGKMADMFSLLKMLEKLHSDQLSSGKL